MPVVLEKKYSIPNSYDAPTTELMKVLIDDFRLRISDDIPENNILNQKTLTYTDGVICQLYENALRDLNAGTPRTRYEMANFAQMFGESVLTLGAIVFALFREGMLQLKNQVDFSDSGLSIGMFNKFPQYQSVWGSILQTYLQEKADVKAAVIAKSPNAGFFGIASEYSYRRTDR